MSERAYADVNRALTDGVVIPGYEKLAEAAAAFRKTAEAYCTPGATNDIAAVKAGYNRTMDTWMRVQPISFGPIELLMRNFRLYFWPAGRSRVEKNVAELLNGTEPIDAGRLRGAGVAVQGLPAVELLLYGNDAAKPKPGTRRCALLTAVARNMDDIATAIVADWKGGRIAFRKTVLNPAKDNSYYASAQDASLVFFKSLYNALELIVAAKLGPVAGPGRKGSVADLESVPSARSLRNIVLNLEAAQALYLGTKDDGFTAIVRRQKDDPKLDTLMRRAFKLTLETARSIEPPIADALKNPGQRRRIDKLMLQSRALKQIIATRLAKALGLAVGFNARDGD